jgi:hypothetical protein
MITRIKTILIIVLVGIVTILNWLLAARQKEVDKLLSEKGVLADNLKSQAIIEKDKVIYRERINRSSREINKGNSKKEGTEGSAGSDVKTSVRYLPPEAKAEICVDLKGNTSLKVKNKGFCLCPAISCTLNNKGLRAGIEARLTYWGRYGLGVGINVGCTSNNNNYNPVKPFLSVERRISDIVAFMRNTTIGITYDGDLGISLGLTF